MTHNKLVRDRIPAIIQAGGHTPVTSILDEEDYIAALHRKLDEEAAELHADPCLEEMADLAEVLLALCEAHGYTAQELHAARLKKHEARGGFRDRIFLHEVR